MRALMTRERPAAGSWDLKLAPGGLVDIEFAAQFLQLAAAAAGGPLRTNTGEAFEALALEGAAGADDLATLASAWELQQSLSQVLRLALPRAGDPEAQPERLRSLLAHAGGQADWAALARELARAQVAALEAARRVVA